jgi:hypothetical protein
MKILYFVNNTKILFIDLYIYFFINILYGIRNDKKIRDEIDVIQIKEQIDVIQIREENLEEDNMEENSIKNKTWN